MRILHTANTYAPSLDGVAEVVRNISERLVKRGHEVHVATGSIPFGSAYAQIHGVHVHRFSARGNLALGMHGEIERYCDFVRKGDWDIVVNHCLQVWPTDAILEDLKSYRWPSVLVTHGLLDDHPSFREYYSEIPQHILNYSKWIRVSDCSEEASYAKKFNLPTPPVITNGVDFGEWAQPPLGVRDAWGLSGKPWVVNVSNHTPQKNHRLFFQLAESLRYVKAHFTLISGTYPISRWGLRGLGFSGGCAYECTLRAKLSKGSVTLKTNLNRPEVISAIKEADVIVSCSKWEANSVVLLESMAAGTPWVSFDVGAARVNVGGITVTSADGMANAVMDLLQSPDLRCALAAEGRARAAERHDWSQLTGEYERIYETAVGNKVQPCLQ